MTDDKDIKDTKNQESVTAPDGNVDAIATNEKEPTAHAAPNADDLAEKIAAYKRKELADSAKALAGNAAEKLTDVGYFVVGKARRVRDAARDAASNAKDGFPYYATWNLGDYLLERAANVCGYLSEQSYTDIPHDYFSHLRECEDVFNAYALTRELIPDLHVRHIGRDEEKDKLPFEDFGYDKFAGAWMWYGQNIIDPADFIPPNPPAKNPLTLAAAAKMRATRGFAPSDFTQDFGAREAERIAAMLRKMAKGIHGHPDKYADKPGLKEREEDWEKNQSIAVSFYVDLLSSDWCNETLDDETIRPKTREEIGVDFCAWVEDILYAAEILELWASWESDVRKGDDGNVSAIHSMSPHEYVKVLDPERAEQITDELYEKFVATWKWIGDNIWGLWD